MHSLFIRDGRQRNETRPAPQNMLGIPSEESRCGQRHAIRRGRQVGLNAFLDRMTSEDQAAMDRKLGDMIFGLGLPLCLVEKGVFKNFVHSIRPSYKIPSRLSMSTTVLDQHYDQLYSEIF